MFSVQRRDHSQAATRRGILSIVSSLFDPLGLVSPVTLQAKSLLQKLCRSGLDWGRPISNEEEKIWSKWLLELPKLREFHIQRCVGPVKGASTVELHIFSDGSEVGYGACAYLKNPILRTR